MNRNDDIDRLQRRTQVGRILRATVVVAVVAIAAVIGFQLSNLTSNVGNSPSPSASAAPAGSPTPPAPSADAAVAGLVLRLDGGGEFGRVHVVTVLEDGRIITTSRNDQFFPNPPVERRLTPVGVQLLRDELDATGLTDTSADYWPVANPGVEAPGFGGAGPSLEVGLPGGGTAVITWDLFADTEQDYFQPQPEAEALDALAARLSTLDDWLPASAWADANATPYAPPRYRIYIYSQPWGGSLDELPVESATVSWPLVSGIDAFGGAVENAAHEPGALDAPARCRVVIADDATRVVEALQAAGATPYVYSFIPGTSFALGYRATSRVVIITLEPIMPLTDASCGSEAPF